jgi:hypothetical protein
MKARDNTLTGKKPCEFCGTPTVFVMQIGRRKAVDVCTICGESPARQAPRTLGAEEARGGGVSPNPLLPELEAEIDMRLANLLEDVPAEERDLDMRLMRVSYAGGYCDRTQGIGPRRALQAVRLPAAAKAVRVRLRPPQRRVFRRLHHLLFASGCPRVPAAPTRKAWPRPGRTRIPQPQTLLPRDARFDPFQGW